MAAEGASSARIFQRAPHGSLKDAAPAPLVLFVKDMLSSKPNFPKNPAVLGNSPDGLI